MPSTQAASHAAHELTFHFAAIDHLVQRITAHEAAWQAYFEQCGIEPFTVVYEELVTAYETTTYDVLRYLNIPIPEDFVLVQPRMRKQSNAQSREWVQRYHYLKQAMLSPLK